MTALLIFIRFLLHASMKLNVFVCAPALRAATKTKSARASAEFYKKLGEQYLSGGALRDNAFGSWKRRHFIDLGSGGTPID